MLGLFFQKNNNSRMGIKKFNKKCRQYKWHQKFIFKTTIRQKLEIYNALHNYDKFLYFEELKNDLDYSENLIYPSLFFQMLRSDRYYGFNITFYDFIEDDFKIFQTLLLSGVDWTIINSNDQSIIDILNEKIDCNRNIDQMDDNIRLSLLIYSKFLDEIITFKNNIYSLIKLLYGRDLSPIINSFLL